MTTKETEIMKILCNREAYRTRTIRGSTHTVESFELLCNINELYGHMQFNPDRVDMTDDVLQSIINES
jgi:hypothetical protein